MKLRQTFDHPISGWWDGGAKQTFDWSISNPSIYTGHDSKGSFIRIGSWSANHWFNVALGKTDKQTLSYAKQHLATIAKKHNLVCKFEYIEED